jgi:hypothetical protein
LELSEPPQQNKPVLRQTLHVRMSVKAFDRPRRLGGRPEALVVFGRV